MGAGVAALAAVIVVTAARPAGAQTGNDDDAPPAACPAIDSGPTGSNASLVPDDCWGRFPSSSYDIGCDEGAWNHISRKIYCTFTDLAFQAARSTTATSLCSSSGPTASGSTTGSVNP